MSGSLFGGRQQKEDYMETKNYTEVYIAGRVYTLGGFEEEEYLQQVAACVNTKMAELREQQGYLKMSSDYQNVLLELNLADDIFKARRQTAAAQKKLADQEKEAYNLRHDLVTAQIKLENAAKQLEASQQELAAAKEELESERGQLEETRKQLEEARRQISQLEKQKYRR